MNFYFQFSSPDSRVFTNRESWALKLSGHQSLVIVHQPLRFWRRILIYSSTNTAGQIAWPNPVAWSTSNYANYVYIYFKLQNSKFSLIQYLQLISSRSHCVFWLQLAHVPALHTCVWSMQPTDSEHLFFPHLSLAIHFSMRGPPTIRWWSYVLPTAYAWQLLRMKLLLLTSILAGFWFILVLEGAFLGLGNLI